MEDEVKAEEKGVMEREKERKRKKKKKREKTKTGKQHRGSRK